MLGTDSWFCSAVFEPTLCAGVATSNGPRSMYIAPHSRLDRISCTTGSTRDAYSSSAAIRTHCEPHVCTHIPHTHTFARTWAVNKGA